MIFKLKEFLQEHGAETYEEAYALYNKALNEGYEHSEDSFRRGCRKSLKRKVRKVSHIAKTTEVNGDINAVITTSSEIKTIEEMAQYCGIDMNDYLPNPKVITNAWGNKGNNENFQIKVFWERKYKTGTLTPNMAADEFKEVLSTITPPEIKECNFGDRTGNTVFIGLSDSHLGQLSYGREVGSPKVGNYDLKIGSDELLNAINYFANYYKDKHVKKFLLMIGSDLLNVNGTDSNVTVNNTPQDEDCRSKKTFGVVLKTMINVLNKLSLIAPVETVYIPGNHDNTVSYFLNESIAMYFTNAKNVKIDTTLGDRKYLKIGNTLLGVCHGKTIGKPIKLTDLPNIMADEARELWGNTIFKEFIIGHYHKLKTMEDDYNGTIVRVLPSITKLSYWGYASGYKSIRALNCYEYDDIKGMVATIVYKPEEGK